MCNHERLYDGSWAGVVECVICQKVFRIKLLKALEGDEKFVLEDGRIVYSSELRYKPSDVGLFKEFGKKDKEKMLKKVIKEFVINPNEFDMDWVIRYIKGEVDERGMLNQCCSVGLIFKVVKDDECWECGKVVNGCDEWIELNMSFVDMDVVNKKKKPVLKRYKWEDIKLVFGY